MAELQPSVVFANGDEALLLGIAGPVGDAVTFVKHGAADAIVHTPDGGRYAVPTVAVGAVADTTGAGDAFAAGVLTSTAWRDDPAAACVAGHRTAAELLRARPRV